jgi:hypothetical protein
MSRRDEPSQKRAFNIRSFDIQEDYCQQGKTPVWCACTKPRGYPIFLDEIGRIRILPMESISFNGKIWSCHTNQK